MESKKVEIIQKGNLMEGNLEIYEESMADPDLVQINLAFGSYAFEVTGENFFEALQNLRKKLENLEVLLICNGAARNVFPSPMMRGMGNGRLAYHLKLGVQAGKSDIVDIFDKSIDIVPASVDEQEEFYKSWLKSLNR